MIKQPTRSPERQALFNQIEICAGLKREVDALAGTLGAWWKKTSDAQKSIDVAEEIAARAKESSAVFALATALGTADGPAPLSARAAALGVSETRDALDALEETRADLVKLHRQKEHALGWAEEKARRLRDDVVKSDPGLRAMIVKFDALRREYVEQRSGLEFLADMHMLPVDSGYSRNEPHGRGDAVWKVALAALESDADAPLPGPAP